MPLTHFQLPKKITALNDANLLRQIHAISSGVAPTIVFDGQTYVNFSSNDYLGLAQHPAITRAASDYLLAHGTGSGASHLVSGHFAVHEILEKKLAQVTGFDAALIFGSGFMANMGVIPALADKQTAVFCDALNHASLIDGVRLSKAHKFIYPHLDYTALEAQLAACKLSKKLIITDLVFSMDGTVADVTRLNELAKTYGAALMLDDAHGFGIDYAHIDHEQVQQVDIYMATLGKAVGVYGAFVAGSQDLITYLTNKARSYVFTTACPPHLAAASLAALGIVGNEPDRQTRLQDNIALLRIELETQGWNLLPSQTAIQPVIIGEEAATLALMDKLKAAGFWVVAIRPPTVPQGSCRLRITLSAAHSKQQVQGLVTAMNELKNG